MSHNRAVAGLLASLSTGRELTQEAYALLIEIIGKVTAALKARYQPADIEDAIAETLLILAQKPDSYRKDDGSLEGFIYVVARNLAAKRLRLHSNETRIDPELLLRTVEARQSETDAGADEAQAHRRSVQRRFDRRKEALAEQFEKLPLEQQTILSAFAEARQGEPWAARHARRTGDDPNRVRVRLHRLLAKLRKEISRRLDEV